MRELVKDIWMMRDSECRTNACLVALRVDLGDGKGMKQKKRKKENESKIIARRENLKV